MVKFFKKIVDSLHLYFIGLVYGMKNTEDAVFKQGGVTTDEGTMISQQMQDNSVASALLRGEVTQDVQELRYRTYLVDRESKKYTYYAPTLALKNNTVEYRDIKYDSEDGLELITSQANDVVSNEDFPEYFTNVGKYAVGNVSKDTFFDVNKEVSVDIKDTLGVMLQNNKSKKYRIEIKRNFIPRYKIEQYTTRIDVKKLNETHAILDIYVSKYPNVDDFKSKGFVREIEKIKNDGLRTDIFDFEKLSFVTSHAYKMNDLVKFVFNNICFREIKEFDGHYIIKFKAAFVQDAIDLTKIFYSKTMDDKYKNKEQKNVVINFSEYMLKEKYVCADCGKEVVIDREMMDSLSAYDGRDITSEDLSNENPQVLEFMDMQLAEQTVGKKLCSECLKKYLKENKMI